MREIKFEFLYTDGDYWIRRSLNLDEIMNGEPFDVISDSPLLRDYKMVAERQYTGLKDCEGVEISEGDVVRSDHFVDVEGVQHYVHHTCEWSDKYSGWYFRNNSESFDGDGGLQAFVMMKFFSERNIKVIGNIHQNPELIK